MKVFMGTEYEMLGYTIETLDDASSYSRRYGRVFDVPKKLVRRHERLNRALERLNDELEEIYEGGGEKSPFLEQEIEDARPKPRFSIYQLRHVKSGLVLIELTTPAGASWEWVPDPGCEPDGVLQWWAKHMDDDRFNKHGVEFRYDDYPRGER